MSTTFVPLIFIVCLSTFMRSIILVNAHEDDNPNCHCVPRGTCDPENERPSPGGGSESPGRGGPKFDMRIVNSGSYPTPCRRGYVVCCVDPIGGVDVGCGIRKFTGEETKPFGTTPYAAYPWQAALMTENNEYFGSGALINDRYVITAAHKIEHYPNLNFKVMLGVWNIKLTDEIYPHQEYRPDEVIVHPSFDNVYLFHDIAIIRLDRTVPLSKSPHINCVPVSYGVPSPDTWCLVAGWGQDKFDGGSNKDIMQDAEVPILDQQVCENQLRATRLGDDFRLDRTSFICAGGEVGEDACTNDGGSPLVCADSDGIMYFVGLVAWGVGCGSPGIPGVYVNVPSYRNWINERTSY